MTQIALSDLPETIQALLTQAIQTAIANEENKLWLSPISIWETLKR